MRVSPKKVGRMVAGDLAHYFGSRIPLSFQKVPQLQTLVEGIMAESVAYPCVEDVGLISPTSPSLISISPMCPPPF